MIQLKRMDSLGCCQKGSGSVTKSIGDKVKACGGVYRQ